METYISLKWKREHNYFKKDFKRIEPIAVFEGLEKGFPKDNESSKRLKLIVQYAEGIYIDFDAGKMNKDINVYYWINKKIEKITIPKKDIIVWNILNVYCEDGEEYNEVTIKWKRNARYFTKGLDRIGIISTFNQLIMTHPENCEVSKRIVKISPVVDELYIDWDSTKDVNELYYKTEDIVSGIPIIYAHKLVWERLEGFCNTKGAKEIENFDL